MNKSVKILILVLSVTICVALVFLLSHAISSPTKVVFKNQYNQVLKEQKLPQQNSSYEQLVEHYERLVDLTNTFHLNNRVNASLADSVQFDYLKGYVPMVYSKIKETLNRPTNWGDCEINRFHSLVCHIENLPSKCQSGKSLTKGEKDILDCVSDIKNTANVYKKASGIAYWYNNHSLQSARQTIKDAQSYLKQPYIANSDKQRALSELPQKIANSVRSQLSVEMNELLGYSNNLPEARYNELKSNWSRKLLELESLKKDYSVFSTVYDELKSDFNRYTSQARTYYESQNNSYHSYYSSWQ